MKTFRVLEVTETVYAYNVKAESEQEALNKMNDSCGSETEDIRHLPEYDDTVGRDYQCEGEI